MPVGCEGVPGAGGARDKWTSRVYRPRLPAGEETPLRVCTLPLRHGFSRRLRRGSAAGSTGRSARLAVMTAAERGFPFERLPTLSYFTRPGELGAVSRHRESSWDQISRRLCSGN